MKRQNKKTLYNKNSFSLCYPILESSKEKIINKIRSVNNPKVKVYELRLDYLNKESMSDMSKIIDIINFVKTNFTSKKIIATVRTKGEGGKINLSSQAYFDLIKEICEKSKADYVDIEYRFYSKRKSLYDKLIIKSKKTIILSKHLFNKRFSLANCKDILGKMSKSKSDILKLAVMTHSKMETYYYMKMAHEFTSKDRKKRAGYIFIAMGRDGLISRLLPEYTNTKIVFINAYHGANNLGQVDLEEYNRYRKELKNIDCVK